MTTAKLIRVLRGSITQRDFAEKTGIHFQQVSRYERGRTDINMTTLFQILTALDAKIIIEKDGESYEL